MQNHRSCRHRAVTLIYAVVALMAIVGVVSLAVDLGRVQTAKTELENATDAAARYAVTGISDSTAAVKAISAAAQNRVDGSPLVLLTTDVEIGTWTASSKSFAVGGSSPNAVRVSGHRINARSTAIPLLFGAVVGRRQCDINSVSVATIASSGVTPDIVGLNTVTLSGAGKIMRSSAESGTVNVGSNGTYSLSWGQQIAGNVLYRGTAPNPPSGSNCITGTMTQMTANLAYATPTTASGATVVGAASYGNGQTIAVPPGNYSATTVTIGGGATLVLSGDVNVYCTGAVDIGNGATINTGNGAFKFTIYQTTASTVNFNVGTVYMRVYAPLSTVTVGGATPFIGSIICNNLTVTGSGSVSYSSALPSPVAPTGGGGGSGGAISMVK